jgi:hypothetical protein
MQVVILTYIEFDNNIINYQLMLCGLVCKLLRPCCSKATYGVIFIRLQSDTILFKGMLSFYYNDQKNVAQSFKIYCNCLHYRRTCISFPFRKHETRYFLQVFDLLPLSGSLVVFTIFGLQRHRLLVK